MPVVAIPIRGITDGSWGGQMKKYLWLLFLTAIFFQNCKSNITTEENNAVDLMNSNNNLSYNQSGNGEGYSGKLTFIQIDTDATCPNKDQPQSAISLDPLTNQAELIIENCQSITPEPIEIGSGYLAYNNDALIFKSRLFQNTIPTQFQSPSASDIKEPIHFLCRGRPQLFELTDSGTVPLKGETMSMDIQIGPALFTAPNKDGTLNNIRKSYVKMGRYNSSGILTASRIISLNLREIPTTPPQGMLIQTDFQPYFADQSTLEKGEYFRTSVIEDFQNLLFSDTFMHLSNFNVDPLVVRQVPCYRF